MVVKKTSSCNCRIKTTKRPSLPRRGVEFDSEWGLLPCWWSNDQETREVKSALSTLSPSPHRSSLAPSPCEKMQEIVPGSVERGPKPELVRETFRWPSSRWRGRGPWCLTRPWSWATSSSPNTRRKIERFKFYYLTGRLSTVGIWKPDVSGFWMVSFVQLGYIYRVPYFSPITKSLL